MPGSTLLIVEDDRDVVDALKALLEDEFTDIVSEANPNRIPTLAARPFDMILLDMNFSAGINTGNEGLYWLSSILQRNPTARVIMMTAYGNIDLAVEAIKRGAKDFVLKPWDNQKLLATIRANIRKSQTKENRSPVQTFVEGKSKMMIDLQERIVKVAATDASVLILGENGTGKELVAQRIHELSNRSSGPFVTVDLSTITPTLFESELFGHKKGAFTDAKTDRIGRLQMANGGTLFLDEIGNLPHAQQSKLLTALQNRAVVPVGSSENVPLDIRLITATNANLLQMVKDGSFRQDLLYRINTITFNVPALRDREDDVLALAEHFLEEHSTHYRKTDLSFEPAALEVMRRYNWPGNVRELRHTIEKAVILSEGPMITDKDLQLSTSSQSSMPVRNTGRTLDELEEQAIRSALAEHGGNIVHAAKALGITRQTFYNKMKRYGIQ